MGLGIDVLGQGAQFVKDRLRHRVLAPLRPPGAAGQDGAYELDVQGDILKCVRSCLIECVAQVAGATVDEVHMHHETAMEVDGAAGTCVHVTVRGGTGTLTLSGLNEALRVRGLREALALKPMDVSVGAAFEATVPYPPWALSRGLLGTSAAE